MFIFSDFPKDVIGKKKIDFSHGFYAMQSQIFKVRKQW